MRPRPLANSVVKKARLRVGTDPAEMQPLHRRFAYCQVRGQCFGIFHASLSGWSVVGAKSSPGKKLPSKFSWATGTGDAPPASALTFRYLLPRRTCRGPRWATGVGAVLMARELTEQVIGLAIEVHRHTGAADIVVAREVIPAIKAVAAILPA